MQISGPRAQRRAQIRARLAFCWTCAQDTGLVPGSKEMAMHIEAYSAGLCAVPIDLRWASCWAHQILCGGGGGAGPGFCRNFFSLYFKDIRKK